MKNEFETAMIYGCVYGSIYGFLNSSQSKTDHEIRVGCIGMCCSIMCAIIAILSLVVLIAVTRELSNYSWKVIFSNPDFREGSFITIAFMSLAIIGLAMTVWVCCSAAEDMQEKKSKS